MILGDPLSAERGPAGGARVHTCVFARTRCVRRNPPTPCFPIPRVARRPWAMPASSSSSWGAGGGSSPWGEKEWTYVCRHMYADDDGGATHRILTASGGGMPFAPLPPRLAEARPDLQERTDRLNGTSAHAATNAPASSRRCSRTVPMRGTAALELCRQCCRHCGRHRPATRHDLKM